MARQRVMTGGGPSANVKKHDEFTSDELLEAMFRRKKQEEDIAAFKKKAMATEQQYRDWEMRERDREMLERSGPAIKRPPPEELQALHHPMGELQALQDYDDGPRSRSGAAVRPEERERWARGRAGAAVRDEEWEVDRRQRSEMNPFGPLPDKPRVYTNDELIEASDGKLTAKSLMAMEVFEKFIDDRSWARQQGHKVAKWPEEDFQKYMRLARLRGRAGAAVRDEERERWARMRAGAAVRDEEY